MKVPATIRLMIALAVLSGFAVSVFTLAMKLRGRMGMVTPFGF